LKGITREKYPDPIVYSRNRMGYARRTKRSSWL
jgi:hypothetical protein